MSYVPPIGDAVDFTWFIVEPTLYRFPEGYAYADLKIVGSRIRAVEAGDEPCPIVLRKPCY